jgi:Tfp pilus assembly protein PilX
MALVMLAVLTLIGVASMSSSSLEMKVAGNMKRHNVAFQAAQSRLAFAGTDPAKNPQNPIDYLLTIDVTADSSTWEVQTCNVEQGCVNNDDDDVPEMSKWVATAEVKYLNCGKGIGNSLEAGKGFSYRIFEITATGETPNGISRSIQASAIRYPVKGCGDEML